MSEALTVGRSSEIAFALSNRAVVIFVTILLLAPSALFAGALRPIPAAVVFMGCAGALILILRDPSRASPSPLDAALDIRRLALFVGLAGFLLVLGGAGHLLYPPLDWRQRDAVLADLSAGALPIVYDVDDAQLALRAPLGMYMLPAAFGRALGLGAAHVALWAQNSLFLGAIFYLLATLGRGPRHVFVMALLSGLSVAGVAIYAALAGPPNLLRLETYGLVAWHPAWQYSSSVVQFFWAPNHALPGWWLATLLLLQARGQVDRATSAVSIAGAMFWTPLGAAAPALWLLFSVCADLRRQALSVRDLCAAAFGLGFIPIALYLIVSSGEIKHGAAGLDAVFLLRFALFALPEFAIAGYVIANRSLIANEYLGLLAFSCLVLATLPLFKFGPGNDLVMRASIPALVVVGFLFGEILLQGPATGRMRFLLGCALLAVAAPSALWEVARAFTHERIAISDCSLVEASQALREGDTPTNYLVESARIPAWIMDASRNGARPVRERRCWSDQEDTRRTLQALEPWRKPKQSEPKQSETR